MQTRTMLAMVAVMLAASAARAGEPAVVAVTTTTTPHDQQIGLRAASDALAAASWSAPAKPLSKSDTQAIARCFTQASAPRCALRIAAGMGASRVAYISIAQDSSAAPSSLRVIGRVVTADVDSVTIATRYCDHCTDDTLVALVSEIVKELVTRASIANGRTVLAVKSTPQGARFAVDGAEVGVTDAAIAVAPGPHRVRIEADGFDPVERNIDADEGKTSEVLATLRRSDGTSMAPPSRHGVDATASSEVDAGPSNDAPRRSRLVPAILLAAGAVGIAGGVLAVVLDQDDVASPRGTLQPQYYYDTAPVGIAAIGGGIVLAGVGGYLFWKYAHTRATPAVTSVRGGAVLGLEAAF